MIEATIKSVKITPEIVRRFWEKVDVRSPDECWPWLAFVGKRGYGMMRLLDASRQQKVITAHRIAHTLVYGTIPQGEGYCGTVIRHSCDNRVCCNPFHLSPGSQRDNMQDAVTRGRTARGEKQPLSKLTEAQVLEIRKSYSAGGVTQSQLAQKYGVIQQAIQLVVTRKRWKHI
jgi:hypothetical protein